MCTNGATGFWKFKTTLALWGAVFVGSSLMTAPRAYGQTSPSNDGPTSADFRRGAEEIYMIKCWLCHNEYAKVGPPLKDLSKRPNLISGEPVNEMTVSEKIRSGSERMPSYRNSLTDLQLADLVAYLLAGKCCPDPQNPPPNPQFRNP